jgi:hypothetical protein
MHRITLTAASEIHPVYPAHPCAFITHRTDAEIAEEETERAVATDGEDGHR